MYHVYMELPIADVFSFVIQTLSKQCHLAFSRPKQLSTVDLDAYKCLLKRLPARIKFGENI